MTRPLIGISLDWVESGSFSPRPHFALRQAYFDAVWTAGGLPVAVPLIEAACEDFLARVDGVVVPGGDYPCPADWYVKPADHHGAHLRPMADIRLVKRLLARDIPLLGICAGFQTMVVATGGKLHLRVADEVEGALEHRGTSPDQPCHDVDVKEGTLLARIVGAGPMPVNSHHHEGAALLGDGVAACASSRDGLVEAIEITDKKFALGVQWHPEFFTAAETGDGKIWRAFVDAAREA